MTWNDIKERLKSPVVVVQIILIVGGAAVIAWPGLEFGWKIFAGALNAVWSLISGLNNPTNKEGF